MSKPCGTPSLEGTQYIAMTQICFPKLVAFVVVTALLSKACIAQEQVPLTATFHSTLVDDGNDLIFPSVIKASDYFDDPLANWYLYTSPHRGANIRLYTADKLTGSWKLHGEVVGKEIGQADHVSSPHAIWNDIEKCLFLYVHAPNNQTIFCRSKDGVKFVYGGVCVTSKMLSDVVGFKSRSASYARVYQHRIPEYDNRYTMTVTASAAADEGKTEGYDPVRLHLVEGDENWRKWTDRGVMYDPASTPPDKLCARGALFVENAGQQWLVYEAGPKNSARIALLKIDNVPLARPK